MNTRTKKYALTLTLIVVMAVLLAFSSPAAADYSGDHLLTLYEHETINGGLVYDTVTDGSKYECLYPFTYAWERVFGPSRPILYQNLTVSIPDGATVKMARLYNTYCWSCWGSVDYAACPPAQAKMNLTDTSTGETWSVTCKHPYTPDDRSDCPNPINSTVCPDCEPGVEHYWDTKGRNYTFTKWDFPSGEFAWDVTGLVTHSGTYNASICDPRDRARVGDERFCTFGFGLLVIYKHPDSPGIEYWVTEGCDMLMARTWETPENATTSATFAGSVDVSNVNSADLTTVTTCSDRGNMLDWSLSENMMYFNGEEIGPAVADGICHYGVNYFDVTSLLNPTQNVVEFQDRDDDIYVHNAFLVLEYARLEKPEPAFLVPFFISGFVHRDGTPVNNPGVTIKNINTGDEFIAENSTGCNYYQNLTSLANVSSGDVLQFTCNETSFEHRVRQEEVDAGGFEQNVTIMPSPPCPWMSYPAIASGLEDIGDRSTPAVFNMSGTWYQIAGESDGTFNGYNWTGSAWVSDSTIVSGLGDVGEQSTPAVFYKDEDATWYLISGRSTGDFVGYKWTGTAWVSDTAIVSNLGTVVSGYTAPSIFCMDDKTWYLISGNANGRFDYGGRRWDAATSTWVEDFDIVSGLGDVGEDSTSTIFNADGTWYLIAGEKDGTFTGYRWTGSVWKLDSAIISGLEDVGEYSAPAAFNMDEKTWYLISGNTSGTFNGFWQVCEPPPEPDLNITDKFETLLEGGNFTVNYTVKNIGGGDAGASNTTIYIDGVSKKEDSVPALAAGDNYTNTVGPFECPCGQTLNVTVCADNGDAVDESDETNNCMQNEFACPSCPEPANVSITPRTLNLKSSGEWVTARIELPEDYSVLDTDVTTVFLEGTVPAVTAPEFGDGVFKFDRAALIDHLGATVCEGDTGIDELVTLTVTGNLVDGTAFEGSDTVRVIKPGR